MHYEFTDSSLNLFFYPNDILAQDVNNLNLYICEQWSEWFYGKGKEYTLRLIQDISVSWLVAGSYYIRCITPSTQLYKRIIKSNFSVQA